MSSHSTTPRRRIRNLNEVREIIAQWQASGQDQAMWCQARGMQPATLQWYLRRVGQAVPRGFIPVRPRATAVDIGPGPVGALVLEMGEGLRVTGLGVAEVVALVRALNGAAS